VRRRPTIRLRLALWCALLVTASGVLVLVGALAITQHTLNANAPKPPLQGYSTDPVALRTEQFALIEQTRLLVDDTVGEVRRMGILGLGALAVLSLGVGWLVAGRMLRPASRLAAAAQDISAASLGRRFASDGPDDELKAIADAFDGMLDRLDRSFDRQRRFVADASHELRTPFTVMRTQVDVALDDRDRSPEELRATLRDIGDVLERGSQLIGAMLTLSRAESLARREPVRLDELVGEAVTAIPGTGGLDLHLDLRPATVTGDPVLLGQLATNLIENAVAYNVAGGRLEVGVDADAQAVRLRVANDGAPIDPSEVPGLFLRFHRHDVRDRTSGGFGLGLSVVEAIAVAHDATVEASARAQGGLEIAVVLRTG
jgi:signal transduction histidine kinase